VRGGGTLTRRDNRGRARWNVIRPFERRRSVLGQPVDRFLADHRVDARLVIKGDELSGGLVAINDHCWFPKVGCELRPSGRGMKPSG
jgi:hypothetical protein